MRGGGRERRERSVREERVRGFERGGRMREIGKE